MVKIVSRKNNRSDKLEYGLLDEKNKVMFYWTEWNWSKKEDDYDYNATMFLENGGDKATLAFLKSIDQTKSELPISLKDSEIYGDTEYTDQYTNDACPVPEFEYNQISFKTDSGKDGIVHILGEDADKVSKDALLKILLNAKEYICIDGEHYGENDVDLSLLFD